MNFGLFGHSRKNDNTALNGFPRRRFNDVSFYGFPQNKTNYDLFFRTTSVNTSVTIYLTGESGVQVIIDWGDDTKSTVTLSNLSTSYQHVYANIGEWNLVFYSNIEKITEILLSNTPSLVAILSTPEKFNKTLKSIRFLVCRNLIKVCDFTGFEILETLDLEGCDALRLLLPDIGHILSLKVVNFGSVYCQGSIPDYSALINLEKLIINGGTINVTGDLFDTSNMLNLHTLILRGVLCNITLNENSFSSNIALRYLIFYINSSGSINGSLPNFNNCPLLEQIYISCANTQSLTNGLPSFSNNPELQCIFLYNLGLTGAIPNYGILVNLKVISLQNNLLTGAIPDLSACTNLGKPVVNLFFSGANPQYSIDQYGNAYGVVRFYSNNLSGNLPDFSNNHWLQTLEIQGLSNITGSLLLSQNPLFIAYIYYYINSCNLSGNLNSFVVSKTIWVLSCHNNPLLTGDFPLLKFSDVAVNAIYANNCSFTSFQAFIQNLYSIRVTHSIVKAINISGTNNATPGGTYQAPSGYIQADAVTAGNDGNPASEKEMIYVLVNQNIDFTTVKRYKYTFTTN